MFPCTKTFTERVKAVLDVAVDNLTTPKNNLSIANQDRLKEVLEKNPFQGKGHPEYIGPGQLFWDYDPGFRMFYPTVKEAYQAWVDYTRFHGWNLYNKWENWDK